MKTSVMVLLAASPILIGLPASADAKSKLRHADRTYAVRDCTPINGFYGYYGNPWCDTGSYRLEDIERDAILQGLKENDFNRTETAKALGISRRALIYKLQPLREQGYEVDPK